MRTLRLEPARIHGRAEQIWQGDRRWREISSSLAVAGSSAATSSSVLRPTASTSSTACRAAIATGYRPRRSCTQSTFARRRTFNAPLAKLCRTSSFTSPPCTSSQRSTGAPQLAWEVNVEGSRNLLEALVDKPPDLFLFGSTAAVYQDQQGAMPESSPVNPVDVYGRTKVAGERRR